MSYHEAREAIIGALSAEDPRSAYSSLVDEGMGDMSDLTDQEIILLYSEFAGNTCAISRALSSDQMSVVTQAMMGGGLLSNQK